MSDSAIQFLLDDEFVELTNYNPNMTILQYLREVKGLTGTKEGCASGDCGACTVVIAAVEQGQLVYKHVNSCITFIGAVHGKQLISVEHLKTEQGLHAVQQAMVDHHASQCGFCTPGFVMSSFALHQNHPQPSREQVLEALAGNLCRCTGYRSIIDAACQAGEAEQKCSDAQAQTIATLINIKTQPHYAPDSDTHYYAPDTAQALALHLKAHPDAVMVAGGTDLALSVTQNLQSIDKLVYLGNVAELKTISQDEQQWQIGAAVTYQAFTPHIAAHYPEMAEMIERLGSMQIRNVGTIGGNIGNASPIGDMPPVLIALGASIELQSSEGRRTMALEDYFKDYKVTALAESEFIRTINLPKPAHGSQLKVYKISKRIDDDISAVLAAIYITISAEHVSAVRIAFGGMAAIPKRAKHCEQALINQPWTMDTVAQAKQALLKDFSPMSDVRASKDYRMLVAQNLIEKCFIEWQQRNIETRVVNYA